MRWSGLPFLAAVWALCAACVPGSTVSAETIEVYRTGYSWFDNTPPGSAAIARPVVHQEAGGTGTWEDPITLAVGHRIEGGRQTLDVPAGTRFYFPDIARYAIVEDVCGDGGRPQDGPCHVGKNGRMWVDIWVGGGGVGKAASDACMASLTGFVTAVRDPAPGLAVRAGSLSETGCF